jgi:hypothetical protein
VKLVGQSERSWAAAGVATAKVEANATAITAWVFIENAPVSFCLLGAQRSYVASVGNPKSKEQTSSELII